MRRPAVFLRRASVKRREINPRPTVRCDIIQSNRTPPVFAKAKTTSLVLRAKRVRRSRAAESRRNTQGGCADRVSSICRGFPRGTCPVGAQRRLLKECLTARLCSPTGKRLCPIARGAAPRPPKPCERRPPRRGSGAAWKIPARAVPCRRRIR